MSPWELVGLFLCLPVVFASLWVNQRYETDGARVPEFEQRCRQERPVLFAVQASPDAARRIAAALMTFIGAKRQVEHHSGRFPWTRYVFTVGVELDASNGIVRVRVESASIRRLRESQPDIANRIQRLLADNRDRIEAVWLHTELREGDDARGAARHDRGWIATAAGQGVGPFEMTSMVPEWARRQ
ncbi:MAG: hypothetical protein HOW73_09090 [Polyangiaceae bacterium]|nr:hypothetical protein [Polyangiaceae bacterium]